jgi:hypothetical protein
MPASTAKNETRLPRQVMRISAAIEQRLRAQRGEPNADPAAQDTPPAPPSDPTATTADPQPQATPPALPQPPADPRETDPAYWKQRFSVVQGVLRTEREERKAEVLQFQQQISELQGEVRALQAASTPATRPDLGQFFTPEQIEELGEEQAEAIVNATLKTARSEVQSAIETAVKPLREERQREQENAQRSRQTAFLDKLAELVPDFAEIDETDAWKAWLAEDDEHSGLQRQAILDSHAARFDAVKVAKMFEAYVQASKPRVPTPPVTPHGRGAAPSVDLPPPAPRLGYPSKDEIASYYKRAKLGKVSDQERAQFDARLKLPRR